MLETPSSDEYCIHLKSQRIFSLAKKKLIALSIIRFFMGEIGRLDCYSRSVSPKAPNYLLMGSI
jgi:hypothetical protein